MRLDNLGYQELTQKLVSYWHCIFIVRKQIHPFYSKASFDLTDPILQPKTEAMKIESSPNLINFTVHKNEIDDQLSDSLPVNDDGDDDYVPSNNNEEEDGSDDEYQGLEMETGLVDRRLNYHCQMNMNN